MMKFCTRHVHHFLFPFLPDLSLNAIHAANGVHWQNTVFVEAMAFTMSDTKDELPSPDPLPTDVVCGRGKGHHPGNDLFRERTQSLLSEHNNCVDPKGKMLNYNGTSV